MLGELLPAKGPRFEIGLATETGAEAVFERPSGDLGACLELRTFDESEGPRALRDIKQQEVYVVPPTWRGNERRVAIFVQAWARGLPSIVAALGGEAELLMPCDLIFPEALDDEALQTEADFAAAMSDRVRVAGWHEARYRGEVRAGLAGTGLGDKVDEFLALRRPSIRFGGHETADADVDNGDVDNSDAENGDDNDDFEEVGCTRFGGEPDLPPSVEWPMNEGRPMTFAAQIDLDELAEFAAARELPRGGLLSFFYDPAGDFSKGVEYRAQVLHFGSREGLERRPTPPDGDRRPAFVVEPTSLDGTMPRLESPFYEAMLPDEQALAFRRALAEAAKGGPAPVDPLEGLPNVLMMINDGGDWSEDEHRLLGYASPHQGDPYLEAEIYSSGRDWKTWEEGSPGALRTLRAARRWRLLLQIRAMIDDTLLLNQDCGSLFFFLPEDALATHDWSRVWCVLQCS